MSFLPALFFTAVIGQTPTGTPPAQTPEADNTLPSRALLFEPRLHFRLASGAEWDTNARRAVSPGGSTLDNPTIPQEVTPDGLVRLVVDADATLSITALDRLRVAYVLGTKRFFSEDTEDLLVHDLTLASRHVLVRWMSLESFGRWRASRIRNALRDYTLGAAGGNIAFDIASAVRIRGRARYSVFDFPSENRLGYDGPTVGGEVGWFPSRKLSVRAIVEHSWRFYEGNALQVVSIRGLDDPRLTWCDGLDDVPLESCTPIRRRDTETFVSLGGTYQGAFIVGLEFSARLQRSNSALEVGDRFRASVFGTAPLPWDIKLSLLGVLQLNRGSSITESSFPVEDDESQNRIEAQLSRRIVDDLSVELRFALFTNEFATTDDSFLRQTFYAGLSYEVGEE